MPGRDACRDLPAGQVLRKEIKMPKLKTKSSVKKRFKITATGKVLAGPGRQAPQPDRAHARRRSGPTAAARP